MDGAAGKVDSVEIMPDGAGVDGPGTMTVILTDSEVSYEIDTTMLEKPLHKHPRYRAGGDKALDDDDLDAIEGWRAATTAADRGTLYDALSANAKAFVDKLKLGEEAYLLPAPLARKTTRIYLGFGTGGGVAGGIDLGRRGSPAGFSDLPGGYVWLKTADRVMRQGARGTLERVEEWTAAEAWDTDHYSAAT